MKTLRTEGFDLDALKREVWTGHAYDVEVEISTSEGKKSYVVMFGEWLEK